MTTRKSFFFVCLLSLVFCGPILRPLQLDLADLAVQLYCTTERDPFDFVGYGCWCGFGGSGKPVDDIDNCCRNHDHCYDQSVQEHNCSLIGSYTYPYFWHCVNHTVKCASWQPGECGAAQCHCDMGLANCVKGKPFHQQYKDYDKKDKCHQKF